MHKKLLLMMLVPILALSMVITSCGGDDDNGVFDGIPTYHRIQGVWYHSEGFLGDALTLHWFFATPNQVAVSDRVGATGVGSRTDFAFGPGVPAVALHEGRYLNQRTFREEFISRLRAELLNAAGEPVFGPGNELPSYTSWATLTGLGVLLVPAFDMEADRIFRTMFAPTFFGHQLLNVIVWREAVEMGVLFDVLTFDPEVNPMTVIPFHLNFYSFYGNHHIGRVSGMWLDYDDRDADAQALWITERFVARHAENQLIPQFGVYFRIMPEDGNGNGNGVWVAGIEAEDFDYALAAGFDAISEVVVQAGDVTIIIEIDNIDFGRTAVEPFYYDITDIVFNLVSVEYQVAGAGPFAPLPYTTTAGWVPGITPTPADADYGTFEFDIDQHATLADTDVVVITFNLSGGPNQTITIVVGP